MADYHIIPCSCVKSVKPIYTQHETLGEDQSGAIGLFLNKVLDFGHSPLQQTWNNVNDSLILITMTWLS